MNTNYKLIIFLILILIIIILFLFIIKSQKNNNIEKFTTNCDGWNNSDGGEDTFCSDIGETNQYICFLKRIFCYITSINNRLSQKEIELSKAESDLAATQSRLTTIEDKSDELITCNTSKEALQSDLDNKIGEIQYYKDNCPYIDDDITYSPEEDATYYNECDIYGIRANTMCEGQKNNLIRNLKNNYTLYELENSQISTLEEPTRNKCQLKYDYKLNKYYDLTLINPEIEDDLIQGSNIESKFNLLPSTRTLSQECFYEINNDGFNENNNLTHCYNVEWINLLNRKGIRYINSDCKEDNEIIASPHHWVHYVDYDPDKDTERVIQISLSRLINTDKTFFPELEIDAQSDRFNLLNNIKTINLIKDNEDNYYRPLFAKDEYEIIKNKDKADPTKWKIVYQKPSGRFLNNRIKNFVDLCSNKLSESREDKYEITDSKWQEIVNEGTLKLYDNLYMDDYVVIRHYRSIYYITPENKLNNVLPEVITEVTQQPEFDTTEEPVTPDTTEVPEQPDTPEQPPEQPYTPEQPDTPEQPVTSEQLVTPQPSYSNGDGSIDYDALEILL